MTRAANPVLVEVVRSGFVESVHRGAAIALGAGGEVRVVLGEVDTPVLGGGERAGVVRLRPLNPP